MTTIRILSIDGGGIRGIIPATVLTYIESQAGKRIHELFDVIGGTSTGGIIALGLNSLSPTTHQVYQAQELLDFYLDDGSQIFCHEEALQLRQTASEGVIDLVCNSNVLKILSLDGLNTTGPGYLSPQYPAKCIEEFLQKKFGTAAKLSTLATRCDVLIPSYDIKNNCPYYFNSRLAKTSTQDDYFVWQAARATSAAPTYFPAAYFPDTDPMSRIFVDGGVFINNPSVGLLAEAKRMYPDADEFFLVSLGTGQYTHSIPNAAIQWGAICWMITGDLLDVMMNGVSVAANEQLQELLPNDSAGLPMYERFQLKLPQPSSLDDITPQNIQLLQQLAKCLIVDNQSRLDQLVQRLS
jgi:patatin-like phospholipase/acyl hydrolase